MALLPLRRPRSLRGQLIALIAALAIPLIALQSWWSYQALAEAEEAAGMQALTLAEGTAAGTRQFLSQAQDLLTAAATQLAGGRPDTTACEATIRMVDGLFTFVVNTIVIDREGAVVCSARPAPPGTVARDWEWYPELEAGGSFAIGVPVEGTLSETWVLPLAVPIRDANGIFAGALAGSVPLLQFGRLIPTVTEYDDVVVAIRDARNIVIAHSREGSALIGRPLPPLTGSSREVRPGGLIARGSSVDGVDRAWGRVETENGWFVYVGVPAESVYGPVMAAAARNVGTALAILLVAMGLATLGYRRIAGSLEQLSTGIRVAAGGGNVTPSAHTPTEIRAVVEHLNEVLLERNEAEASEREARQRYQSIFDNAVFGLCILTPEGRFLEVNPALVSMLGYPSPDGLIAAGSRVLVLGADRTQRLIPEGDAEGVVKDAEAIWMRADGKPITVRMNGRPIRLGDGARAFELLVADISEERRREDELRHTQKMEAVGKLAGGIAHDFNNLLLVIGGNVDRVEEQLADGDPAKRDLAHVREAVDRAAALSKQLLTFSRKDRTQRTAADVYEVISNLERLLGRLIGADIELVTRLGADRPFIGIEPTELEQIAMNLALNARDAMPAGGTLTIETRTEQGTLPDGRPSEGLVLRVTDTGQGMDPETRSHIFEPFYTTKPVGQGTGLGLSTVYGIVKQADGHISVESHPGRGTAFSIWFPTVSPPTGSAVKETRERQERQSGRERILVAEDEALVRTFVQRALGDAGYEVVVASDGVEALQVFEAEGGRFDLVLTDVVMPRLRGPELAKRLAMLAPQMPILFMSGYIESNSVNDELARDPDALLRKPFRASELGMHVRRMLERQGSRT